MTVFLPRLSAGVQLIDPRTGIATAQGANVWNALCAAIEAIVDGDTVTTPDTSKQYEWQQRQTFDLPPIAPAYRVGSNQVVGAQQPAIANLAGSATTGQIVTALNMLLAELRAHGLIGT